MFKQNVAMTWSGRVLAGLIGLMLAFSASMKLAKPDDVAEQMVGKFGYPRESIVVIGVVEAACLVLYLVPQTAVLGAVLLTGYLGGAIATHVRVGEGWFPPFIGGVLVWLSLFLRDGRIRALLPLSTSARPADAKPGDSL